MGGFPMAVELQQVPMVVEFAGLQVKKTLVLWSIVGLVLQRRCELGYIIVGGVVQFVRRTYHIMLVDWVEGVAVVLVGIVVVVEEHLEGGVQKNLFSMVVEEYSILV